MSPVADVGGRAGRSAPAALLDAFLPEYDVSAVYARLVRAPVPRVYAALRTTDFGGAPLVRLLVTLRAIPAALVGARTILGAGRRHPAPTTLQSLEAKGFSLLAEDPPRELVLGLVGRFWTPSGGLRPTDPTAFRGPQPPGTAKAAWNFRLTEVGSAETLLSTETRVRCVDAPSRRRFRLYWLFAGPGSGAIRRSMLRSIARAAEDVRSPVGAAV
jgi:hypothetical protein